MRATLWLRRKYLDLIIQGQKTLEIRVGTPHIRSLGVGDILVLKCNSASCEVGIRAVRHYASFVAMLEVEPARAIGPAPKQGILRALRRIYTLDQESLGVYVLEIEPVPCAPAH